MENEFKNIELLVSKSKVDEAEIQLSKFGSEYHRNSDYLYLRSKIFYLKKLYYICIDTIGFHRMFYLKFHVQCSQLAFFHEALPLFLRSLL